MPRQRELLSSTSTMGPSHHQLTYIFLNILRGELSSEEKIIVDEIQPFYEEVKYQTGEAIFRQGTHPEAFYIVLQGSVAVPLDRRGARHVRIRSGAGTVDSQSLSSSNLLGMIGDVGQRKSVESVSRELSLLFLVIFVYKNFTHRFPYSFIQLVVYSVIVTFFWRDIERLMLLQLGAQEQQLQFSLCQALTR